MAVCEIGLENRTSSEHWKDWQTAERFDECRIVTDRLVMSPAKFARNSFASRPTR